MSPVIRVIQSIGQSLAGRGAPAPEVDDGAADGVCPDDEITLVDGPPPDPQRRRPRGTTPDPGPDSSR